MTGIQMGRGTNRLIAIQVKNLTAPGLYLQIAKGGSMSRIHRFSFAGRKRDFGIGSVTDVSLATARQLAGSAREKLAKGIDPFGGSSRNPRADPA